MSRTRSFCFTINNYTEDDIEAVKALGDVSAYMIVGKEVGENGTPHLQGYVYFKDAKTFTSVKKKLSRAHIEVAKGTHNQNIEYCSKQEVLFEYGEKPTPGKRKDIENVRQALQEGDNLRAVVDKATSVQSIKMAEIWLKYNEPKREWKPEVRWYWGPTGAGKTRSAHEWLEDDVYSCMRTCKWFEGYDGHENVLIDDFRKDFCKYHELLLLLDRYEYRVETKGGSRQLLARKIAITSPYHPRDVYSTREDIQQLLRRIDEIIPVGDAQRNNYIGHDIYGISETLHSSSDFDC